MSDAELAFFRQVAERDPPQKRVRELWVAVIIAAIEAGVPSLVEARVLVDQFHDIIRKKDEAKLDVWIANAKTSLVSSLATGVLKDRAAVRAAITQPWSNGQVEAQITKLKLVKRQMYGRAKIDLLEARLLGTA